MSQIESLKINRKNIDQIEAINFKTPDISDMAKGSVLLKLDIFSLSANNITYAVTGNSLNYWGFFPVDEQHSQLPVWGFGHVVASTHPDFAEGDRFYGYYPMSSHILVKPSKVNAFGFVDSNPSRVSNNPVYDHYTNVKSDIAYRADDEGMQSLFRPLFITSFLSDDFLTENDYFNAEQILITSASSKTAYGLASILSDRKANGKTDITITALTSVRNVDFVDELGMYDHIITYDKKEDLDTSKRTVIVDFTGNQKMLKEIAAQLGEKHAYTSLIGAVQNDRLDDIEGAVKHGSFFFAPIQAQKCIKRYGHEEFSKLYSESLNDFIAKAKSWLRLEEISGSNAIAEKYLDLLKHSPSPREGLVAHY